MQEQLPNSPPGGINIEGWYLSLELGEGARFFSWALRLIVCCLSFVMWEDYSFSIASQRSIVYDSMDESISPDSSRGASPFANDKNGRTFNASCSITELSQQFDRHTLGPQRQPSYLRSPPTDPHDLGRDRPASAHNQSAARRQRQSMVRRQCSAANISRLSSLVQDLLEDDTWSCDTHIAPLEDCESLPPPRPDEIPPLQSPTFSSASTSSCSEDGEFELHSSSWGRPKFKVGKEMKHSSSKEAMGRQYKDIRIRKSVRRKPSVLGGRHE